MAIEKKSLLNNSKLTAKKNSTAVKPMAAAKLIAAEAVQTAAVRMASAQARLGSSRARMGSLRVATTARTASVRTTARPLY
ncbi:MAG TPA: hypothetical protein VE291_10730 [Terracidiphilus sp.]|nr:hypothetical protein [Terracidiphilus sp.]